MQEPRAELTRLVHTQQIYYVKAIEHPPRGGLDLTVADGETFFPDKLRNTLERLYVTVVCDRSGARSGGSAGGQLMVQGVPLDPQPRGRCKTRRTTSILE
jgi:hypothetical protein